MWIRFRDRFRVPQFVVNDNLPSCYIIDRVIQKNDSSDDDIPVSRCSSITEFFMKQNSIMEWIKNAQL